MKPGDRVRIGDGCAWRERVGCMATVVAPAADGTYPQPARWEVLLLLDDDPLERGFSVHGWSCVMAAKDCESES